MLAINFDQGDDHVNSDAVERLAGDLLVTRLLYSKNGIFCGDLNKALNLFEATKVLQNRVFLRPR